MAHILIVDDEKSIRMTVGEFLRLDGHTVTLAEEAAAARARLRTEAVDVVVTDIILPRVSGVTLLQEIKAATPDVQVIMMTGEPTVDTAVEAVRAGAYDYLAKPVGKPELLAVVRRAAALKGVLDEKHRLEAENRRYQENLERTVAELDAARRTAEAASLHKSAFLANMSHELRTPLNSILGFAQLLQEQTQAILSAKQQRYLANIYHSGQHLLQLLSDILDLSKVEAGKVELHPERLAVSSLLEDILVIVRGLANKKGQTVQPRVAADLPPLAADPLRLKQILFNLLSNAVKFTPEGGTITVRARTVNAECGMRSAECPIQSPGPDSPFPIPHSALELSVTDTGIGIRAEDLPKLFREFSQLETTRAQAHEGTGLGLALTKRLVELHGGQIRGESGGEGKGSTFTILLPLRVGEAGGK